MGYSLLEYSSIPYTECRVPIIKNVQALPFIRPDLRRTLPMLNVVQYSLCSSSKLELLGVATQYSSRS